MTLCQNVLFFVGIPTPGFQRLLKNKCESKIRFQDKIRP